MKIRFYSPLVAAALAAIPTAYAATWTGATNGSWATGGNWTGTAPDNITAQAIVYDSTSIANLTQTLNASYTVTGITLTSPTGAVTVSNGTGTGNTLTIGSGGIDMSAATQNLTLSANLNIGANQTWTVAGGRTLSGIAGNNVSSGSGTGNINMLQSGTGTATIVFNQNGNASGGQTGWSNYSGNITINSNVKVQSQGNAAAAFGSGAITLAGGTIAQNQGNWTWSNNIAVSAASVIANDSSNGLGRTLKLLGDLTSSNSSGLTFTNNVTGGTRTDDVGFILAGANASTYTTTTISANSRVRVGGNDTASTASAGINAGNRGSLGTGDVTLSASTSELAFTRTDAHTVGNKITGSGTVVIGGNTTAMAGTSTQVVTLSGASNYTGATRVSRSRLNLTGSLTSAITVDNSGSISGNGSTTGLLTLSSGSNIVLAGGVTTTSLTSNGATFGGSNLATFLSTPLAATQYVVFNYGAGTVTNIGNLTVEYRGTLSNDVPNQRYVFTLGTGESRTWNTTTGTWAVNSGTNFSEGDQKFFQGDHVNFGNIASNSTVTMTGRILPGSMTVNNAANAYTFTGTAIDGTGSLSKSGDGILTLSGANTYNGGTTLNAGILRIGNNSALGTGSLAINGGTLSSDSGTLRTLANNLTIGGNVAFGDGTNGGQLVFDGTVNLQGATRVLTSVLGTQGARFNGIISNGGITMEGTGRITLANDGNTFTGATTINAGILATSLNALASSGSVHVVAGGLGGGLALASNGTTTIKNLSGVNGSVIRSDFNLGGDGARSLQINQTTNGEFAGSFTQGGGRTISLIKEGAATLTLSGTGGYTGTTTINDGVLEAAVLANGGTSSSIGTSGAGAGNLVFGAATATLRYAGTTDASTNRGFTMSSGAGGGATIESSGTTGKLTMTAGTAISYGTANETRVLTLGGTYNAADNVFGKALADNGSAATSLVKNGASIWQLSNANTYTGGSTVNAGRLTLENNTGAGTGTITLNSGTGTNTEIQTGGGLNVANALVVSDTGDQKTFRHFNTTSSEYSGSITINETTQDNFRFQVGSGASLKVSGEIGGGGGFQKINSGTLELTNANSYSGDTTITTGSLLANNTSGSATGSGAVGVASGATLGGTGTISGAVTVTGKIAPGSAGIGTLNTGTVTWKGASAAGSTTNWEFALGSANASDKLNISGDFTKDTTLGSVFNFDFLGSSFMGVFTLAKWTGSTTYAASDFSYSNLGAASGTFTINGLTKELQFTAVPEPTTAVAGLLLGAGLLRRRRVA